jgi:hypothetical protein
VEYDAETEGSEGDDEEADEHDNEIEAEADEGGDTDVRGRERGWMRRKAKKASWIVFVNHGAFDGTPPSVRCGCRGAEGVVS